MAKTEKSADDKVRQEKLKALNLTLGNIEKNYGKGTIMKLGDQAIEDVPSVSTGSLGLDHALGIHGLPRGRVTEIYGPESSGKTTLALHAVAEAQRAGGIAAFIDAEHAFDRFYAKKLGVDIDNLLVSQPDNGEQALEIVDNLVRSGAIDIIVIDSVAALTPRSEIEGEMGDSKMGLQARLMSQALRKLTANISRLALYFDEWTAFTAAMVTWFASSAVYYAWPLTFMPHAISLFFVLLFLFYAEKSRYKESWKRWAVLGLLAGTMALMRWQNLIFILFIFPDVWKTWKEKSPAAVLKNQFLPGFLFSLLIFLPQVIAWFILYGRPFTVPQGRGFLIWSRPKIFSILFSTFNGLFTWTPVTLFGIVGIVVMILKKKEKSVPVALLVIFLFQLY
ncbi:MAG: ATPase domain-containing protein, partial [Bacteroidales bacterium]